MKILVLLGCVLLVACSPYDSPTRGQARMALFKECMELAAKMPRQADDDVSDIVNSCSTQSWYMTNHIH